MSDHPRIWLEADCPGGELAGEGRTWCKDPVYDACPDCGAAPTEYVRADLYRTLHEALTRIATSPSSMFASEEPLNVARTALHVAKDLPSDVRVNK